MQPGTRLGPYEILSPLGAGGMGQVYRARDTRLDRTVAIKVLPDALAADQQFRERFDREARAVAALNHPNICTLYDVGQQNGVAFLVMELVEGDTLTARLEQGALPIADALRTAIEIAAALDKAHRAGIVHRDLKPGNIMLTKSGAKLLDFGLAKTTAPAVAGSGLSMLPTTPLNLTMQGTILGTFQYMAPEQLDGAEADARTDVFALGAVLYEMVTGRKAFEGKSHASLIGAIMHAQPPPMSQVQPLMPAGLDQLVTTCLAKDPDERWQTAGDVARQLKWIAGAGSEDGGRAGSTGSGMPSAPSHRGRTVLPWAVAIASMITVVAVLALALGGYFNRTARDRVAYRASILGTGDSSLSFVTIVNTGITAHLFAISPDGQRLVFAAMGADRRQQLWIRRLDALAAQPLEGTVAASAPFWSPDSRYVAFMADGKLKKIDVGGGPATTLADAPVVSIGAWSGNDVILFAPRRGPLFKVPASGGSPSPVTVLDSTKDEAAHFYPSFLPDQRHFVYVAAARTAGAPTSAVYVASLEGTEKPKLLLEGTSNARYADGYLLFARDRTLMAQAFDVDRLVLRGEAVPVAEQVDSFGPIAPIGAFSVSENVLLYQTGTNDIRSQLTWFDRAGKRLSTVGEPADQMSLELSRDGSRAVVSVLDPAKSTRDLWIYDVARGLRTRFTFDPSDEINAMWSPDGSRVVFNSRRKGNLDLYVKAASGAGGEEPLLADTRNNLYPGDWSADGDRLLYYTGNANAPTGNDIWLLQMPGGKPRPVVQTAFNEIAGRFSPDGRFVAYHSDESGRLEIYVTSSDGSGGKWQVSSAGGQWPRWRRDGKEIFFLSLDNKVMSAAVDGEGELFQVGAVTALFSANSRLLSSGGANGRSYDVSADGQRFLINTLTDQAAAPPLTLVVNWPVGLKK